MHYMTLNQQINCLVKINIYCNKYLLNNTFRIKVLSAHFHIQELSHSFDWLVLL